MCAFSKVVLGFALLVFGACQFEETQLFEPDMQLGETGSGDTSNNEEPCVPTVALQDDFQAGGPSVNWNKFTANDSTEGIVDGVLTLTPGINKREYSGVGYQSTNDVFSLEEHRVHVEVKKMVNHDPVVHAGMRLRGPNEGRYNIEHNDGRIRFRYKSPNGEIEIFVEEPYDEANSKIWQFRVTDDTFFVDIGPDHDNMRVFGSDPLDSDEKKQTIQQAVLVLVAESRGPVEVPGSIHFDNLNLGGPECEP